MMGHLGSLMSSLGQKQLSVCEIPLSTVQTKRLSSGTKWSGVIQSRNPLVFTGIQLAHAVIKADFLDHVNPIFPGIGFILQSHHIIDWQQPNLCIKPGGHELLSDFAQTSMAGRIGQGLALLFAYSQGYRFTAHVISHLSSTDISRTDSDGRLLPAADFICDGYGGARALIEAKGSFSRKNNISATKALFKKALTDQVDPWMKRISPPATKAFVVGSYLREGTNKGCDPSTLVFVDPEGKDEIGEVEITPETVRRENFAAWLSAMGLFRHGERLRDRQSDNVEMVEFAIFKFGEQEIAFPAYFGAPFFPTILQLVGESSPPFATGIHIDALKAISEAVKGDDVLLREYQGFPVPQEGQPINDSYSMFPDGTFFGKINPRSFIEIKRFKL